MAARCLAADVESIPHLSGRDIRVLDYSPGVVDTDMQAQIRATSQDAFPARDKFTSLHASQALVDPKDPACELADLLEDPKLEAYSARRFGG